LFIATKEHSVPTPTTTNQHLNDEALVPMSVLLTINLRRRIRERATELDETISALVREALARYLTR
jgi:hypothetical protein